MPRETESKISATNTTGATEMSDGRGKAGERDKGRGVGRGEGRGEGEGGRAGVIEKVKSQELAWGSHVFDPNTGRSGGEWTSTSEARQA